MSETVEQGKNGSEEKTFTQSELNAIVNDRLKREKEKYADYEALKEKASKYDSYEESSKTELQKITEKAEKLQNELDSMKQAESVRGIREKIAKETGVPAELLSGTTEEDCKTQAEGIKGGGNSEPIDVNLSNFDPRNATAVEMFAYCEYKDYMGAGVNSTWGSWHEMKSIISPADGMDFSSLENIMNKKMNWTKSLSESKTVLEKVSTGEKITAAELLTLFEENYKMTSQDLKDPDDWRTMSDDEWDKMLEGIDKFIEAFRERLREMIRKQQEAALKAASEAPAELRSLAASQAALNVAANGFFGGEASEAEDETEVEPIAGADPGVDHENNWTRKLKTDNQEIIRTAKAAQEMESKAIQRMEEFLSGESSGYESFWNPRSEYYKNLMGRRKNEAIEV